MRRPPAPLAALLAAVAIVTVAWALFVPPFQAPDEASHISYSESLARHFKPPPSLPRGVAPNFSLEELVADGVARGRSIAARERLKPPWTARAPGRFEALSATLPRGVYLPVRGALSQADDPPLYYAVEAIPYKLAGGGFFGRLFAMRLVSAAFVLLTTSGAWLLAGELTGRDRLLQLVAAGCVGLQPMVTFISGVVNPDAAGFAVAAIVLWLGVRVLNRGATRGRIAALLAALLAAALVKTVFLTLVPAVAVALAVAARRARAADGRSPLPLWGLAAGSAAVVGIALALSSRALDRVPDIGRMRGFASYLWQFYLPRLSFQSPVPGLSSSAVRGIWIDGAWARFGWLEIGFPRPVYWALGLVSVAVFAGALVSWRRGLFRVDRAVLAFFAIATVCLVGALHLAEYDSLVRGTGLTNQGRYLLPLLPIAGVATAAALTNLRPARRSAGAALVLGLMAALQLFSLAVVGARYYV